MNAYSLEKNDLNKLENNYSLSDKADGDRYFMFINN